MSTQEYILAHIYKRKPAVILYTALLAYRFLAYRSCTNVTL